mmetsp:Transcript_39257/g.82364  ORF Transcript_39257/g.82364 Transcript_39257/m.82364 type:complete len:217 (-) Transcript_39257:395-1045(-)
MRRLLAFNICFRRGRFGTLNFCIFRGERELERSLHLSVGVIGDECFGSASTSISCSAHLCIAVVVVSTLRSVPPLSLLCLAAEIEVLRRSCIVRIAFASQQVRVGEDVETRIQAPVLFQHKALAHPVYAAVLSRKHICVGTEHARRLQDKLHKKCREPTRTLCRICGDVVDHEAWRLVLLDSPLVDAIQYSTENAHTAISCGISESCVKELEIWPT